HRGLAAPEGALDQLSQACAVGVVGQEYRHFFEVGLQELLEGHVVEAEVICVENNGAGGINAAGDDDAYAVQAVLGESLEGTQLMALCGNAFRHLGAVKMGEGDGDTGDDFQSIVHKSNFNIGAADVHADLVHAITPWQANFAGVYSIIHHNPTPVKENVWVACWQTARSVIKYP